MRKLLLLVSLSALAFTQAQSQRIELPKTGARPTNFYAPNRVGSVTENEVDVQGQFERGDWTRGIVRFKNGLEANGVWLVFDVHNNKLYFKENGLILEFTNPIKEFFIGLIVGEDTTQAHYRCEYPAVNSNTTETFYEVVVDAPIQLLWCRAKSTQLYKDENAPEQRRSTEKDQWYVFAEGKMVKIKRDKNEIAKALPAYADRINSIVKEKGLRLKEPDDFIRLFALLNGLGT